MTDQTPSIGADAFTENAEYAFIVVKQKDGRFALANVENEHTIRQPSLEEVLQAMFTLQNDLQRQQTVMAIVSTLQQAAGGPQGINTPAVKPEKKFVKRDKVST